MSNAFSNNNIYYADFDEVPQTYTITAEANQTFNVSPTLIAADLDKFGLTIYNADGVTPAAANYTVSAPTYDATTGVLTSSTFTPAGAVLPLITAVSLVDSVSNTEVTNPCTGLPYTAKTDTQGRIATDLPLDLSSTASLKLKVSQYLLTSTSPAIYTEAELNTLKSSATTVQTYDLVENSVPVTDCVSTPDDAPIDTVNNLDGIPVFWNLSLADSTPTAQDPALETYLAPSEVLDSSTTICDRVTNNFNPRFADVVGAQSYLTPIDPIGGAVLTSGWITPVSYVANVNDLQLLDSTALGFFNNTNNAVTNQYDSSLTKNQNIAVQCIVGYYDGTPFVDPWINVLGNSTDLGADLLSELINVPALDPTMYDDCTTLATNYGLSNGLDQYFSVSVPNSQDLLMAAYYADEEGYLIFNTNTGLSNDMASQASSSNPFFIEYL